MVSLKVRAVVCCGPLPCFLLTAQLVGFHGYGRLFERELFVKTSLTFVVMGWCGDGLVGALFTFMIAFMHLK